MVGGISPVPEHPPCLVFTMQACDGHQGGHWLLNTPFCLTCTVRWSISPCLQSKLPVICVHRAGMRWSICAKEVCFKNKLLQQFFANGKVRRGS